jgi:hypothetical protein
MYEIRCHIATPTFTAAGPRMLLFPNVALLSSRPSSSFLVGVLRGDQAVGTVRSPSLVDHVDSVSKVSMLRLSGLLGGVTH